MFESKSGKKFMNAFKAKRHSEAHGVNTPKGAEHEVESKQDMSVEAPKPSEVVAEHGKAHKVTVSHDHESSKHSVESHHEDGHVHKSDHESAEEAHDHAKQLAGVTEGSNDTDEQGSMSAADAMEDWA